MGQFTAEVHVWNTQIVSILVFSGDHMKRSSPCSYDSFIMAGGMDEEPNLPGPDFLSNGFAGITLKNHTVIPPMRMDSGWSLRHG